MNHEDEFGADVGALLEVNRLDFRLPPSLSVATSRAEKHYPALVQDQVMGDTIQFLVSSGAAYVDLMNSYISFDLLFDLAAANEAIRMSPHVGYANMFQKYVITHSSGVELDRQNAAAGEWAQIKNYYDKSQHKRRVHGSLYCLNDDGRPGNPLWDTNVAYAQGKEGDDGPLGLYDSTTAFNASGYTGFPDGGTTAGYPTAVGNWAPPSKVYLQKERIGTGADTQSAVVPLSAGYIQSYNPDDQTVHVVIPLASIAGIFDNGLIAPSFLMSGMRIDLQTYTKEHFFQLWKTPGGAAQPTWNAADRVRIRGATIHLESFQLTDAITRKLSKISGTSGLEWYWDAVHQSQVTSQGTSVGLQVNRALSRANNVIVKTRSVNRIGNPAVDSFASDPWKTRQLTSDLSTANAAVLSDMNSFQVQLGSEYIPAAPIQDVEDFLHSAIKTFGGFRRIDDVVGVPLWDFIGNQPLLATTAGTANLILGPLGIAAVPLETSSTLQQAGAAISAQRTAVVNCQYTTARADAASARQLDLFIVYSKLATLFLDSTVVRS